MQVKSRQSPALGFHLLPHTRGPHEVPSQQPFSAPRLLLGIRAWVRRGLSRAMRSSAKSPRRMHTLHRAPRDLRDAAQEYQREVRVSGLRLGGQGQSRRSGLGAGSTSRRDWGPRPDLTHPTSFGSACFPMTGSRQLGALPLGHPAPFHPPPPQTRSQA